MRKVFKLRLWGVWLGPTDVTHPLLTSVHCTFNLLRSFKDDVRRSRTYFIILSDTHGYYASIPDLPCMRVWDPWKLNVSVYENAGKIVSWMLLAFKGFYNTHTQPVSMSYRHEKRCMRHLHIRKQWLAYFLYTETVIACVSETRMILFYFCGRYLLSIVAN